MSYYTHFSTKGRKGKGFEKGIKGSERGWVNDRPKSELPSPLDIMIGLKEQQDLSIKFFPNEYNTLLLMDRKDGGEGCSFPTTRIINSVGGPIIVGFVIGGVVASVLAQEVQAKEGGVTIGRAGVTSAHVEQLPADHDVVKAYADWKKFRRSQVLLDQIMGTEPSNVNPEEGGTNDAYEILTHSELKVPFLKVVAEKGNSQEIFKAITPETISKYPWFNNAIKIMKEQLEQANGTNTDLYKVIDKWFKGEELTLDEANLLLLDVFMALPHVGNNPDNAYEGAVSRAPLVMANRMAEIQSRKFPGQSLFHNLHFLLWTHPRLQSDDPEVRAKGLIGLINKIQDKIPRNQVLGLVPGDIIKIRDNSAEGKLKGYGVILERVGYDNSPESHVTIAFVNNNGDVVIVRFHSDTRTFKDSVLHVFAQLEGKDIEEIAKHYSFVSKSPTSAFNPDSIKGYVDISFEPWIQRGSENNEHQTALQKVRHKGVAFLRRLRDAIPLPLLR